MRNIPGWVLGALGVTALVGATYAGSRIGAAAASTAPVATSAIAYAAEAPVAAPLGSEFAVECEPGQRAVVSVDATMASAPRVSCVSDARPVRPVARASFVPAEASLASTPVVYVDDAPARPQARRAAIVDPVEVYRPRSVPVSSPTRYEIEQPRRSVKKSVAIIAGTTAAGAVVGGLVKGRKGAVIGGLVGGGAATVWDQVTRRRDDR